MNTRNLTVDEIEIILDKLQDVLEGELDKEEKPQEAEDDPKDEEKDPSEKPAEEIDLEEKAALIEALEKRKAEIKAQAKAKDEELRSVAQEGIKTPIMEEEKMEQKSYSIDSKEYRAAWLKQMAGMPMSMEERAAMSTVDVVPTITENTIINRLKENKLLQHIDFTQYKGYVNIPNYTTNGDAAWGSTNEQQDVIGHVALSLYQLIKTVEIPGVYDVNSIDAFEGKMVEALTNKIEAALQKAVIVGTGSGNNQPTGINATHSAADGTFTHAGITKADLMKIMGKLGDEYQQDAVWIMPSSVFYEAMAVCDLPGFVALNAELKPVIGGKPVITDSNCVISNTDTVFYGAGKAYHLNLGAPIEVARDTSIGFKSGAVNYRAIAYADGKLDNANAFVKYTRATE